MKSTSSVSSKGLTTIPKEIRKKLNIQKRDKIHWILSSENTLDLVVVHEPLKSLTGKYSKKELIYEKLEHIADKLVNDKMEH